MTETLVVRTFGVDVYDGEVGKALPWKVGRLFPWLFTRDVPVCFLGVGRGWRGYRQNGSFSSRAALKAIPFDGPVIFHINRLLAWVTNFTGILRISLKSNSTTPLIVLAHTPQYGLGAALAKVLLSSRLRFVVRVIGNEPSISLLVRRSMWRFKLERGIERFVLSKADIVLPMGNYTSDLALGYGVDPEKIVVLPFPVTWPDQPSISELPARPTVLFCGRLIKEKGVHILLQSMKLVTQRVSGAQLVIVGDTDNKTYRNELEELVDSLGIRDSVSFLGWIPNERIAELYRESWVLVIPSIWEEGLGMVMVEAGLMGRAVIGSNLGGITDFVVDGTNGYLVPPSHVEKLTTAITDVLEDRTRAIEMGKQSSVMAHKYLKDFDGSVRRVQQAIDKLT